MKRSRGFTLIEIMVAMIIVAILATIGISAFQSSQQKSRDAKRKADLTQITKAFEMFMNDVGNYPIAAAGKIKACSMGDCDWGTSFVDTNGTVYLASLPKDTVPKQTYYYEYVEPKGYRIYARLENTKDQDALKDGQYSVNCGTDAGNPLYCNYMLGSENVPAPTPYFIPVATNTPTSSPTSSPTPTQIPCPTINGLASLNSTCLTGSDTTVSLSGQDGTVSTWEYFQNGVWKNWGGTGGQTSITWNASSCSGCKFRAKVQKTGCDPVSSIESGTLLVGTTYYRDADSDGYGWAATTTKSCATPAGYVANNTDCDDNDNRVHPGQTAFFTTARANGNFDYNCDGVETQENSSCGVNLYNPRKDGQSNWGVCAQFVRGACDYSGPQTCTTMGGTPYMHWNNLNPSMCIAECGTGGWWAKWAYPSYDSSYRCATAAPCYWDCTQACH